MTDYHFKYEGEVVITADFYEEAEEKLKNMLRGIFTYRKIHHTVGMFSEQLCEDEEFSDPCPKCGTELEDASGGGVKCPNKDCDYWFCY